MTFIAALFYYSQRNSKHNNIAADNQEAKPKSPAHILELSNLSQFQIHVRSTFATAPQSSSSPEILLSPSLSNLSVRLSFTFRGASSFCPIARSERSRDTRRRARAPTLEINPSRDLCTYPFPRASLYSLSLSLRRSHPSVETERAREREELMRRRGRPRREAGSLGSRACSAPASSRGEPSEKEGQAEREQRVR